MYQPLFDFVTRMTIYVSGQGLRLGQQAGDSYQGSRFEVELTIRRKSINYARYALSTVTQIYAYAKPTPRLYK